MGKLRRYTAVTGKRDLPLVVAFHGLGQRTHGIFSAIPWFWSFPYESRLLTTCQLLDWSCFMPQASHTDWRPKDSDHIVPYITKARQITGCLGPLVLFGFSDGGMMAHLSARRLMCVHRAPQYEVQGLWTHSSLFPSMTYVHCTKKTHRVVVSCNASETKPLPFNEGRSMQDERLLAYDWYESRGYVLKTVEGSKKGHHCDPSLNQSMLQWLVA